MSASATVAIPSARIAAMTEEGARRLARAGIADPEGDAACLVAHACEVAGDTAGLVERVAFDLIGSRVQRIPLAYILGWTTVMGLRIEVGPGVFVPRRESEDYVRHALSEIRSVSSPRIADLFSGSAALALAVAHLRPDATVYAVELSDEAMLYAQRNRAARLRAGDTPITLVKEDVQERHLLAAEVGRLDLVLSNPPYVKPGKTIPEEWSRHQPSRAIYDPEGDGLSLLRASATAAARLLAPGGRYVVEHDDEQGSAVRAMLEQARAFLSIETHLDARGRPRWTRAVRTAESFCAVPAPPATMHSPERRSWVRGRLERTSSSIDICFAEGLTGHVFDARDGKRVRLVGGGWATEFVSCSYLGLEQHPALVLAARDAVDRFGVHFSSSRNRMRPDFLPQLDEGLSRMHAGQPCVSFTSVSAVHLGILPILGAGGLPSYPVRRAGPFFLVERTAHASMQVLRGILQQLGPVARFDLGESGTLSSGLQRSADEDRTPILLVDGVGSMGGLTDVVALQREAEAFGGYLYIDDAHGTSIAGACGEGYAAVQFPDALPANVLIAGSLSKAFGGAGGYVVLRDETDVAVARKAANPLVFGHSIMLPLLAANVASVALHLNGELRHLQAALARNLKIFDARTNGVMSNACLPCPIRGLTIEGEDRALNAARALKRAGILVLPAFYPTVRQGAGLLRFAISAAHDGDQLAHAADVINEILVGAS
jgi:HemK-like putative methylase